MTLADLKVGDIEKQATALRLEFKQKRLARELNHYNFSALAIAQLEAIDAIVKEKQA